MAHLAGQMDRGGGHNTGADRPGTGGSSRGPADGCPTFVDPLVVRLLRCRCRRDWHPGFFAALGLSGQLLALLVFVYLALASSGGTVPLQALSGFYRFVANFEPLRQILDGIRAILYFNATGDAGLYRGLLLTAIGLAFWLVIGTAITRWYDRKGFHRIQPELLEYVQRSAAGYQRQQPGPPATGGPPD